MTKLKKTIALISAAAMCCSLAACGDAQNGEDSESAAETSAVSVSDAASNDDGIKAVFGEIRTELTLTFPTILLPSRTFLLTSL